MRIHRQSDSEAIIVSEPIVDFEKLAIRPIGQDEYVHRKDVENFNTALVRYFLLRVPLRTRTQAPIACSDPRQYQLCLPQFRRRV